MRDDRLVDTGPSQGHASFELQHFLQFEGPSCHVDCRSLGTIVNSGYEFRSRSHLDSV
jgi:hypothetical protein